MKQKDKDKDNGDDFDNGRNTTRKYEDAPAIANNSNKRDLIKNKSSMFPLILNPNHAYDSYKNTST
eukprot:CAMPEP_0116897576 /NCGR_PEP_ID=MMETSP0467-20121206/6524_1 /TAXON_ID=283647 /ORGANISM="Mesodinium pulex, Strain SPMC105" /LENGTH=65 /DNA_ID=CAMNT_0004569293 /DNA_START=457 /DNA_END=654 /DNA_ORIENTATION=-